MGFEEVEGEVRRVQPRIFLLQAVPSTFDLGGEIELSREQRETLASFFEGPLTYTTPPPPPAYASHTSHLSSHPISVHAPALFTHRLFSYCPHPARRDLLCTNPLSHSSSHSPVPSRCASQ